MTNTQKEIKDTVRQPHGVTVKRMVMWCWQNVLNLCIMALCFASVTLTMIGVGALELERKIEFFVFVVPTSWVVFLHCYFLIKEISKKDT